METNHKLLIAPSDAKKIRIDLYCNWAETDKDGDFVEPICFALPEPTVSYANFTFEIPDDSISIAIGVTEIDCDKDISQME